MVLAAGGITNILIRVTKCPKEQVLVRFFGEFGKTEVNNLRSNFGTVI